MKNTRRLTMVSILLALAVSAFPARAKFEFEKGDRVAMIGGGLADRMQHHGWLETLVQGSLPESELVFRNMAFPGDDVDYRPRNANFTSPEDYLKLVGADVIFVFFGYNESFDGAAGVEEFKEKYGAMIDAYRELKPNGERPRFVLFSPIAHENLGDRNLPDGAANNKRLVLYSRAVAEVAKAKGEMFVDLFVASQHLYNDSETPLTINGIHLNEEGNRLLAEVMAEALLGKKVASSSISGRVRGAVIDKNWHWYNRYRATDGNDVWGGRSTLKFVNDQTNAEVLQHELTMLDVMTANRDRNIWSIAGGGEIVIDDSNVPPPIPVISNVGGGSKSSNAEKEGSLKYISGKEGLSKMIVPEGFEVNLFADEKRFPELVNPVQLQVDGKGRVWAAAWQTYPKWEPLKEMNDCLLILPDEDGDGVADRAITFAKVHNPLAFEFWNGGVLVNSIPEILFLKDTDGDDVADVREVYLSGIDSADTHHAANNFIYGPDGAIYWQSGIFLQNTFETPWGPALSTEASGMYRFDPRRYAISFHAANTPNSHGISFDRWGYHYATDGTSGNAFQVRPEGTGFKMYPLIVKEVRPVPASEIVSSANFPEDMQGDFLICNTIGFLGIKRYDLNREGGSTLVTVTGKKDKATTTTTETKFGEVWGEPMGDLLSSTDPNFRPTDTVFGADGSLYVSDWQNVIIGHMQHNVRDPNRDHENGRIYRIVNTKRPLQEPVQIEGAPVAQLLANLEHPIDGVRHRTRVELSERDTDEVIAATHEWMKKFDATKKEDAHPLMEALWLHQQHNRKNAKLLTAMLQSPEPHARVAAATVQHLWFNVDTTASGAIAVEEDTGPKEKSGVISDTPELTEVRIGTIVEQLKYDVKDFKVKAGKKVRITFVNPDFMPHNLLVVQPKSADEIANQALLMGAEGFAKGFLPENDKIIAATKMLENGGEETIEFTAPSKPGEYEFVCTFPGHHLLMRGIMEVVE